MIIFQDQGILLWHSPFNFIARFETIIGYMYFVVVAPTFWNSLSDNVKSVGSVITFWCQLKTCLDPGYHAFIESGRGLVVKLLDSRVVSSIPTLGTVRF